MLITCWGCLISSPWETPRVNKRSCLSDSLIPTYGRRRYAERRLFCLIKAAFQRLRGTTYWPDWRVDMLSISACRRNQVQVHREVEPLRTARPVGREGDHSVPGLADIRTVCCSLYGLWRLCRQPRQLHFSWHSPSASRHLRISGTASSGRKRIVNSSGDSLGMFTIVLNTIEDVRSGV